MRASAARWVVSTPHASSASRSRLSRAAGHTSPCFVRSAAAVVGARRQRSRSRPRRPSGCDPNGSMSDCTGGIDSSTPSTPMRAARQQSPTRAKSAADASMRPLGATRSRRKAAHASPGCDMGARGSAVASTTRICMGTRLMVVVVCSSSAKAHSSRARPSVRPSVRSSSAKARYSSRARGSSSHTVTRRTLA